MPRLLVKLISYLISYIDVSWLKWALFYSRSVGNYYRLSSLIKLYGVNHLSFEILSLWLNTLINNIEKLGPKVAQLALYLKVLGLNKKWSYIEPEFCFPAPCLRRLERRQVHRGQVIESRTGFRPGCPSGTGNASRAGTRKTEVCARKGQLSRPIK